MHGQRIWMTIHVDGGPPGWIERTEQVKSFRCAETKYHLVSRYHDKCLNTRHTAAHFIIIIIINNNNSVVLITWYRSSVNGDTSSQWEGPNFDPTQNRNPRINCQKWHSRLAQRQDFTRHSESDTPKAAKIMNG